MSVTRQPIQTLAWQDVRPRVLTASSNYPEHGRRFEYRITRVRRNRIDRWVLSGSLEIVPVAFDCGTDQARAKLLAATIEAGLLSTGARPLGVSLWRLAGLSRYIPLDRSLVKPYRQPGVRRNP